MPGMIDLHNLSKSFDGSRFVASDLQLHVDEGERLVIVGTSDAGKSTTLMMIHRLIDPTSGYIVVAGQDSRHAAAPEWRRDIGYVSQKVGLYPHLTVAEHVAAIPRMLGWSPRRICSRTAAVLELVGLSHELVGQRLARELSPASRQRVKLARSLASDPKVVLLDDPFGPLDAFTREELRRDFVRVLRALRITAVMATRDLTEAMLLGDRVAVLQEGRIVRLGTAGELRGNPGHGEVAAPFESPRRQGTDLQAVATPPQVSCIELA
jgi:osmoprotectant transport system ATP-binding protein